MKNDFQQLAKDLMNDTFSSFKEVFIFVIKTETQEYNENTGQYDYLKEEKEANGIAVKISKDLLASGIYSTSDIKILFEFNEVPLEADLGIEIKRLKTNKIYTVEEMQPDAADATISIVAKGV